MQKNDDRAQNAPLDLEAIEARVSSTTPGPWEGDDLGLFAFREDGSTEPLTYDLSDEASGVPYYETCFYANSDYKFMRQARQDTLALIAEVKRLRAAVERVREWANADVPRDIPDPCAAGYSDAQVDCGRALDGDAE